MPRTRTPTTSTASSIRFPIRKDKQMRIDTRATQALRAVAIVQQFDKTRPIYQHSSGNMGADVHAELLSRLRADAGAVRLVRALGHQGHQAAAAGRIWRAVPDDLVESAGRTADGSGAVVPRWNGAGSSAATRPISFPKARSGSTADAAGTCRDSRTWAASRRPISPEPGRRSEPGAFRCSTSGKSTPAGIRGRGAENPTCKVDWDNLQKPGYQRRFHHGAYDNRRDGTCAMRTSDWIPNLRGQGPAALQPAACWPTSPASRPASPAATTTSTPAKPSRSR